MSSVISDFLLYVVICLLSKRLVNPLRVFGALVVQVLLSGLWAYYAHRWYFSKFPAKRTAVIYDVREGLERLVEEYGLEKKFKIQIAMNVQQA